MVDDKQSTTEISNCPVELLLTLYNFQNPPKKVYHGYVKNVGHIENERKLEKLNRKCITEQDRKSQN